jgi:hypothetical protein
MGMLKTEKSKLNLKYNFMAISDVQQKGNYLEVYGSSNKKISSLHASGLVFLGVASDFFVVQKGSYFETYDEKSKRISSLHASRLTFKNAAGSTFNVKKGSYIESYDKNCKKTGSRYNQ